MSHFRKHVIREPKKDVKRRYDENALKNVISMRVSDEEMVLLARISKNTSKSISDIMREALKGWQAHRRRLCLDI